jgi:hypothetical protein
MEELFRPHLVRLTPTHCMESTCRLRLQVYPYHVGWHRHHGLHNVGRTRMLNHTKLPLEDYRGGMDKATVRLCEDFEEAPVEDMETKMVTLTVELGLKGTADTAVASTLV